MTRFIAVVSGKGGVGKTTVTVNVAQSLIDLGRKTIVLDANLLTPNIGIHLGLVDPPATVNQFLRQEKSLKDITYLHESGLSFIPASPSYVEFQKTNLERVSEIFEHLDNTVEFVVVDAPSGLGYEVSQVLKNSDEVLLVVTPTLSSVIDALKTMELAKAHNNIISGIILNMSNRGRHELKAGKVEEILGQEILANIRYHRKIRKALHHQAPAKYLYPWSRPSRQFKKVAQHLSSEA